MTFYTLSMLVWVQERAEQRAYVCTPLSRSSSVPVLLITVVVPPGPVVVVPPGPIIAPVVWGCIHYMRLGKYHGRLRHDHGSRLVDNHRPGVNRNGRCGSDDNRKRHSQPNGDMNPSRVCRARQGDAGKP